MQKLDKNKILGQGWQYTVYDLGNGRVYKRFNSVWQMFPVIWKERKQVFWRIPWYVKEMKNNAIKSFDYLDNINIDKKLLGDFERRQGLDYEQDKALSIKEYLKDVSEDETRRVVDKFIGLVKIFWEIGFIDKAMKVGKNFGVNKNGEVVLIDLGEIWYKDESIKQRLKKRIWAGRDNMDGLPEKVRPYYIKKMDEIFLNR